VLRCRVETDVKKYNVWFLRKILVVTEKTSSFFGDSWLKAVPPRAIIAATAHACIDNVPILDMLSLPRVDGTKRQCAM